MSRRMLYQWIVDHNGTLAAMIRGEDTAALSADQIKAMGLAPGSPIADEIEHPKILVMEGHESPNARLTGVGPDGRQGDRGVMMRVRRIRVCVGVAWLDDRIDKIMIAKAVLRWIRRPRL